MILALVLAALRRDPDPGIVGLMAKDGGVNVVFWPAYVEGGRVRLWGSAVESLAALTESSAT